MSFPPPPLPTPSYLNVVGSGNAIPDTSSTSSTVSSSIATDHHTSTSWRNLSPSILIILIILSVTAIASVALCLLLRHLNRRCLRHLSFPSSSRSSSSSTATAVPIFSSRRISPETPQTSVIDSLPSFTFSSVTRRSSSSISGDCAVCLSKFEKNDRLRLLPLCCHAFHAGCIDIWLSSNVTCPLCRSSIFASDSDLAKVLQSSSNGGNSFRLEIGSISRRGTVTEPHSSGVGGSEGRSRSRSYSIGSFEYLVEEDSEIALSNAHRRSVSENKEEVTMEALEENLVLDVGGGRSWIKEYVDRFSASLSSRAMSFRSSGRFFTGSSRRSEVTGVGELDLDANREGEEISELFRWLSGV